MYFEAAIPRVHCGRCKITRQVRVPFAEEILLWENDGFAIWYKRLELGTFSVPAVTTPGADGSQSTGVEICAGDLNLLLSGADPARFTRRKRFERPGV